MNRRTFLQQGAGTAALAAQTRGPRANIVFVLSDDHRFDFIGAMGHPWLRGRTPSLDRMMRDGVHFRNAFVTTSLCSPSRASILTSQYIFRHGVVNNSTPLPAALATFPALLKERGYRTAFIGKWHMGGDDRRQPGFDHWLSFRGQGEYFDPEVNRNDTRVRLQGYMADILTDETVSFMRANKDTPFCVFLAHKNVHDPFEPAPRHRGLFRDREIPLPATYAASEANRAGKPEWLLRQRNSWHGADGALAQPNGFDRLYRGYCEGLLSIDDSIGRIRSELQRLGLAERTLLVYTSDNGYLHGEHGLIDKRVMHEPSIRVPLLMEGAGLTAGTTVDEMALNIDFAPTFLELADVPVPSGFQGRSLAGLLRGVKSDWRKEFAYVYHWEREAPQTPTILGLRTERYSYMQYHGVWDRFELYDIVKDPAQRHNLLGDVKSGMRYGRFERFIADASLRRLHDDLQSRLAAELKRLGGRFDPEWGSARQLP
jgi:N-acetylglucosamine-6-sulfatase